MEPTLRWAPIDRIDPRPWLPMRKPAPGWEDRIAGFFGRGIDRPHQWMTSRGGPRCLCCGDVLVREGDGMWSGDFGTFGACQKHRELVEAHLLRATLVGLATMAAK